MEQSIFKKIIRPLRWIYQKVRQMTIQLPMTVATRLQNLPEIRDGWPKVASFFFMGGMLLFLAIKLLPSDPLFHGAYFVWDKFKDCLFLLTLILCNKQARRFLSFVFIYALIRFLWQIITIITGEDINTSKFVNSTWLILVIYMTYLSIKEMLKRNDQ